MISVGGSIGGGENMVNAGLSMKLGQGNHVSTSKVAMAKEIKDLRAELENVKGALLKVADGRPLDSMDMDKMQLFPDVPEIIGPMTMWRLWQETVSSWATRTDSSAETA